VPNNRGSKRAFGNVRKLPSGRFQARYLGPDGRQYAATRGNGDPLTFETKGDAEGWLSLRHSEVLRGEWLPAPKQTVTFAAYAGSWLAGRELAPRTHELYRRLLTNHIEPRFDTVALGAITKSDVRTWHAGLTCGRTAKAHAYQLLHTCARAKPTARLRDDGERGSRPRRSQRLRGRTSASCAGVRDLEACLFDW